MKLATTTEDFNRFCGTYRDRVTCLYEAGFRYIDLSFYDVKQSAEFLLDEHWKENARELKAYAQELGMQFVQAHSPGGNPFADTEDAKKLIPYTERSILVCKELGIPNIVMHSGVESGMDKAAFFEKNREFHRRFIPVMEETGVNVLVENSTKVNMGTAYWVNSGADIREFVEYADHPQIQVCWDTGHGNCEGNQYEELTAIGDRLYGVHINDNTGVSDLHTIPFLGTVNMDDVMHGLLEAGYKGYFTFESCSVLRPYNFWLGDRKRFEKDRRLSEPTLQLQKDIERFMYHVGEHILTAYDCFEE